MKTSGRREACCLIGALFCTSWASAAQAAPAPAEMARIERLLVMLGSRKDMRMVRNGTVHDPETAVTFLRRKLNYYIDDIKTAEDFIDRLATRSSTTGQLYWVRLPDGRDVPAGEFLRVELVRLDKAAAGR